MRKPYKNIRRYSGMQGLSLSLDKVTKPIFKKRGFAENKIITDWGFIVGKTLEQFSTPKKLSFRKDKKTGGVLYVEVYDGGMATEMTYTEPIILEKIANYFGYKAVERLKIIQRPSHSFLEDKVVNKRKVELSEDQIASFDAMLSDIEDEELKDALRALGEDVLADEDKKIN